MYRNDSDSIGHYWTGTLPNITGNTGNPKTLTNTLEIGNIEGCFYIYSQTSNDYGHTSQGNSGRWALGFDASRSSSIYDNNTVSVIPANLKMYQLIKY